MNTVEPARQRETLLKFDDAIPAPITDLIQEDKEMKQGQSSCKNFIDNIEYSFP